MQYLSLNALRETLNFHSDLLQNEQQQKILIEIEKHSNQGEIQIGKKTFDSAAVKTFILSLDAKKLVFIDWIDQKKDLLSLLEGELSPKLFRDTHNWKEHALYPDFQQFLSPYLQDSFLLFREGIPNEKLLITFSYASLLPSDDKMFIEQMLFKPFQNKFESSKEFLIHSKSEKELMLHLDPFCNDSVIGVINYLSRTSYATKLWYLDQMLWVIQQKACTIRLANWILKQLERIALNPEHEEKINDLKKDLQHGKIKTKNTLIHKKNRWSRSTLLTGFIVLVLAFSVVWIIVEKPFSSTDDNQFESSTSFEQFTKEERKKIDSLLREIQPNQGKNKPQIDPSNPILGNGISLEIRKPLENVRMEDLYQNLLIDVELHEQNLIDSCSVFPSKSAGNQQYAGVKNANSSKGKIEILFKNESDYDVYLLAFEDETKGKIYSKLIQKKTMVNLKFNIGDQFLFIAGNQLGKFIAPKNSTSLPSTDFDHHFCQVDENYSETISTFYILERPQSGLNKLLFSGDKNGYFSVIDLYGVLEVR